ncbi:apolipophorins [Etheostoma spectabile]|uniref:apolipophorins n=1 Tax=Etheostoma spectabile TaxID=54343 RepID=UPI0013AEA6C4|nr:apolipophorins [Etheostoma spectabile]
MAMSLLLPNCLHVTLFFLLIHVGNCFQTEPKLCDSSCAGLSTPDLFYQRGVRYTYRYSTTITTTLHGSNAGRNGLALDCVVDINVISKCHLMMQIRNPQIKRLSPQKEHSVQRLKSLRESLERARLKISLQGGKVTALCLQEGEQVWALNIKRALLSMLQTSRMGSKQELEKETDVYGMCTSRYERRGPVLLKSRDLKQCQQSRLANFWPHSVSLTEDTSLQSELHCVQRHGLHGVMEEVNCTEAISMATWSTTAGLVKTQTVSTLRLLRAQPGTPSGADSLGPGVLTDLQFEDEGAARPEKARASTPQQASQTVRILCSLTSDPQLASQEFLQLAFQLRDLTLSQLKTLWQEASFKCRNDWQPLLDALPACGSENCIILLTDLMRNKELEEEQAYAFLTTIALIPHPSPQIINSINALLEVQEVRSKALLAGSSLVYQLCQRPQASCSELPQVRTFIQTLKETLKEGSKGEQPTRVKMLSDEHELIYALKSVGNTGLSAPVFIPLLNHFMLDHSTTLELRLAAIQAFRRFPCSADRSVLLQLYCFSQEDPEVRIAAYQQLMHCPDQHVFEVVKMTLRNETSSQVGSYVWSHLTNVLRSEDPMKQVLIESLPDNIISRDFEAEFFKFSSYSDYTVSSGMGITNVETSLVFSPKSFLPRSATANLTLYFHGRAHNLLEVDLHVENAEPLLSNIFGHQTYDSDEEFMARRQKSQSKEARRTKRKTDNGHNAEKEMCLTGTNSYLSQARAMLFGRWRTEENRPKCWVSVKVFGNEISLFTCKDLYNQIDQLSLSMAGLAVKLLKGHEVQLDHRAVLMTDELVLPSLSGLPVKLGINMTSLLSLRLKGNVNYRDTSHFSLTGYIKPNAYVGLSARMGVDGALGQAAVEWVSELTSSTSLDGSVHLQEGRDVRVTLNTPEDVMDIMSLSSRVFRLSGEHREEIKGPKSRVQKTTCTPKTWSKMVGWQLCYNASYPLAATSVSLPAPGPVYISLSLLKLDRGLHYYLLEAAYSLLPQKGTWLPREASIHLLLATPQSSIPRDMSVDLTFSPHRLLLRITHPLKTIHIQGQLEQERNIKSGKLELLIDGVHYYIMGLVETQTLLSEQRTRYHLEAKMAANGHPMILSANVTRGLGRKTSFSATVKNVFRETASVSVALERRQDGRSRQYSVEAELLLPGVVGTRVLGLMEQKGSLWSSALRLKYGVGGDARYLRQECYTSQRLRSERDSNLTYIIRADHEFSCSNTAPINHKIHLRHEESPCHIKSALDMSYGKHWDEINNKRTLLLSQSFKNQSTHNHTSYTLEFSLQVPEKNLNYRTQLLHSHLRELGSESSTHLKVNYNNLMPLVAGLHWKIPPKDTLQKKWEGTFNMDTPWLYIYTAHKLSQHQHHTLQLTSELTASKWLTIPNLMLEGFYRNRGREREARLELYTSAATYIQAGGWVMVGKQSVKASGSLSSLWTSPLRGDVSLETLKFSHTLQMASTYGKHNVSLAAVLNTVDKVGGKTGQPFQAFPQTLLLRETFTIDLLKGLYILESKAGFHGNKEVLHTLTFGYYPPSPFL